MLYRIDPRPFDVALAEANAKLAAARARLDGAGKQLQRFETLANQQSSAANELDEWREEH